MSFVTLGHPINAPAPLSRCATRFPSPLPARQSCNQPGFRSTLLPTPRRCHGDVAKVVAYAVDPAVPKISTKHDQLCRPASNGLPLLRPVHLQPAYSSPRLARADLVRTISGPVVQNPNMGASGGWPAMNRLVIPQRSSSFPRAQSITCRGPRAPVIPLPRWASYDAPTPRRAELLPHVALEQGLPPMTRVYTCPRSLQASGPFADSPSHGKHVRVLHADARGDGEADASTCRTVPPRTLQTSTSQGPQDVRTLSDRPEDGPNVSTCCTPPHGTQEPCTSQGPQEVRTLSDQPGAGPNASTCCTLPPGTQETSTSQGPQEVRTLSDLPGAGPNASTCCTPPPGIQETSTSQGPQEVRTLSDRPEDGPNVSTCCTLPPGTQETSTSQGAQEARTLSDQPEAGPNLVPPPLPLHEPIAQMNSENQGSTHLIGQTPRSLIYTASDDVDSSVIGTLTTANTPLCTPTPSALSPGPRSSVGPRISVTSNDAQEVAANTPLCTPTQTAYSPPPRLSVGPRISVTSNDALDVAANTPLCTSTQTACSPGPSLSVGPRILVTSNDAQEVAANTPLCTPTQTACSPGPSLSDGLRIQVASHDAQEVAAKPCSDPDPLEPRTWVSRYMEEFGYTPRSAQQLIAFAAHRGGQLKYSSARELF